MSRNNLIALIVAGALLAPALVPTAANACIGIATRAKITRIDEALRNAKLSDRERQEVKTLRATAAKLLKAAKIAEAERVVRQAIRILGLDLSETSVARPGQVPVSRLPHSRASCLDVPDPS